jgi:arsenite oxidase large subunit
MKDEISKSDAPKKDGSKSCGIGRREFLTVGIASGLGAVNIAAPAAAASNGEDVCLELPPENAETFTTTCQYCMVQCGYNVSVWERGTGRTPDGEYASALGDWISPTMVAPAEKGGKDVYIAIVPDMDCVVNQGGHSVRGGTNAQTIFSKNLPSADTRLTQPMIRKDGELVEVDWDEAIAFTAENLNRIKAENGPDALGLIWGDWLFALPTHAMLKLWFTAIGSSSHAGNGWFFDEESSGVSHALGSGTRSFTEEDFEETELLVTAGTNIRDNGTIWYNRMLQNNGGAKQIVFDPRRTAMARDAEADGGVHLMLRPGTDYILATAIIQEILRREAWDKGFVDQWVTGFDKLRDVAMMDRFSLENAAKATGVPVDKIKAATDLMIAHKGKTMVLNEKGIMHQMAAFENQHAVSVMGLIMGNVGKPGACVSRAGGHPGGTWSWPKEPESRSGNTDIFKGLREGKVKALWAFGNNVYKQVPDVETHRKLIADTFFIVQDRIITEMNEDADVVFPAATWGETNTVLTSVTRRVRLQQKFMDPPGNARPDWQIVAGVAKAMGHDGFDWQSDQDVWDEVRGNSGDIRDVTWELLTERGTNGVRWPFIDGQDGPDRFYGDEMEARMGKRFFKDDNKVHVEEMEAIGKLAENSFEWTEIDGDYPLMAFDFRLNELWNTGYTYWSKPEVSARHKDAELWIHPDDAAARGIANGDKVRLSSRQGACEAVALVTDGVIAGSVGIPALFPKKGQEFNSLTRATASPVNGDFDTMVASQVVKA